MLQKDYVNKFLVDNFERIQQARLLNGFSWKPTVEEILAKYPEMKQDPKLVLDPNNESHRDRVRNNFLTIRKKRHPINSIIVSNTSHIGPPYDATRTVLIELEDKPFKYLDTYNPPKAAPTNETEEFKQWKREKDRVKNQQGMHIVVGCVHLPAVNKDFYTAFLKFVKDASPILKGIHLIGDILDCKALSQHDNGQVSEGTLEEEYTDANVDLDR